METFAAVLAAFGITPTTYPFLFLGGLIIVCFVLLYSGIGKKLAEINSKVGRVKDNVTVVITHLSASASARGRLDTNLIQVMSPMFITPQGREVLNQSGFIAIMENVDCRLQVLAHLSKNPPNTRLDVESLSLLLVASLLEKEYMVPVKTYLYNNPNTRDSFMVLAGLYIRDEYLKDHPEITA